MKFKYVLSSGPGGQNVNKINTKVQVRVQLTQADWIPKNVREKLLELVSTVHYLLSIPRGLLISLSNSNTEKKSVNQGWLLGDSVG